MSLTATFLIIFAYLLGSVSTAIIVCRMTGKDDPRIAGSKNPGATNVYRIAGTKAAIFTLIGDITKGLLPVWLAQLADLSVQWQIYIAIAALIGHCYPIYFKFNGGKGVATAFGGLVMIHTTIGVGLLAIWLATIVISRTSSVAAMVAAMTVPLSAFYVMPDAILQLSAMALIVVWRHHENIMNILAGKENKLND